MNFYVDSGGNIIAVDPERVFQGSAMANTIRLVGAFPASATVTVTYILPDGTQMQPQLMTFNKTLSDVVSAEKDLLFSIWEQNIGVRFETQDGGGVQAVPDYTVLSQVGNVGVVFTVSQANENGIGITQTTARSSFICEKGKPLIMPSEAFDDYESLLNQILSQLSVVLQAEMDNAQAIETLQETTQSLEENKVNRAGDTMTGRLNFTGGKGIASENGDDFADVNAVEGYSYGTTTENGVNMTSYLNGQIVRTIQVNSGSSPTIYYTYTFPDKSGTIALVSDIEPLDDRLREAEEDIRDLKRFQDETSGDAVYSISVSSETTEESVIIDILAKNAYGETRSGGTVQLPPYVKKTGDTMSGALNISAGGPDLKLRYGYEVTFSDNGFRYGYDGIQRIGSNAAFFVFPSDVSFSHVIAVRSDLAPLQRQLELHSQVIMQSGLMYTADDVNTWNERVTADGANVLDGSKAILKKVVGNTVACKNYFDVSKIPVITDSVNITIPEVTKDGFTMVRQTGGTTSGNESTSTFVGLKDLCPILRAGQTVYMYTDRNFTGNNYIFLTGGLITGSVIFEFGKAVTITEEMLSSNNSIWYIPTSDGTYTFSNIRVVEEQNAPWQPYFTGLKSASFGGIESTNADGTETSTLAFPKTEMPLGKTIDFENKKITDYGVELVLNGAEQFTYYKYNVYNGVMCQGICQSGNQQVADYVSTDSNKIGAGFSSGNMWCGYAGSQAFFWIGVLDKLGFTTEGATLTAEEQNEAVAKFKAWLAQRYADGNPVAIRYLSSTLQSETDFTTQQSASGNEYTAYKGGAEKVLSNDNAEFGANNTMTINYVFVSEVQQ